MSAWAKPGVKCVCVDDHDLRYGDPIFKGAIYTIERVMDFLDSHGNEGVRIVEAKSNHPSGAYLLRRFRPLISQSDDVALFKHHLLPTEVDA